MKINLNINSVIKTTLAIACLAALAQFGFSPKNANATSSALTGKCALISSKNMVGFDNYCSANSSNCNLGVNALVMINFDSGTYQYAATAISNPWTTSVSTSTATAQGTMTVTPDDPFVGFYKLTMDTGEEHTLVPVNSGNTILTVTKASGHKPAQTGVCQKV